MDWPIKAAARKVTFSAAVSIAYKICRLCDVPSHMASMLMQGVVDYVMVGGVEPDSRLTQRQ
jgi:hypothetical protein